MPKSEMQEGCISNFFVHDQYPTIQQALRGGVCRAGTNKPAFSGRNECTVTSDQRALRCAAIRGANPRSARISTKCASEESCLPPREVRKRISIGQRGRFRRILPGLNCLWRKRSI